MYRRQMAEGRLADPDCSMGTDPRSDPRMVEALAQFGLDANMPVVPLTIDAPLEERLAYAEMCEAGIGAVLGAFASGIPDADGVTTTAATITGEDGNDVTLYISRPDVDGPLPAVVHLHGGGMAIASAADATYSRLREYIAGTGLVVVGVEFRNSGGKLGPHTFPAGLNDCASGVRWVAAHRTELGVSHLIVSGESGGGNLTLTVGHKAKREGWLHEVADELPSLRECDGYFINLQQAELLGSIYNPDGAHSNDPTCFAGVATDDDLSGLPPHVISVNELDPMRDEGLDYYRRLVRAGVPAVGRVVAGTCHGGDMLFAGAMPDVFAASVRDLSGFAKGLG